MKLLRSKLAAVGLTGVLGLGMVLASAPPAHAWAPVPVLPASLVVTEVAASSGGLTALAGGICSTGVGCAVLAVGAAVGIAAWWAYNNQDTIAEWIGTGDAPPEFAYPGLTPGAGIDPNNFWSINPAGWIVRWETFTNPYRSGYANYGCRISPTQVNGGMVSVARHGLPDGNVDFAALTAQLVQCELDGGTVDYVQLYTKGDGEAWTNSGGYSTPQTEVPTTTTVTCRLADGSTAQLSSSGQAALSGGQVTIPSCSSAHPGSFAESVQVDQLPIMADGTNNSALLPSPILKNQVQTSTIAQSYPDCAPGEPVCALQVLHLGVPCVAGAAGCLSWYARATSPATASQYSCRWGPYTMPISDCLPLRYAYQLNPGLDPNGWPISPDPSVVVDPEPSPAPTPPPVTSAPPPIDDPTTLPPLESVDAPGSCSLGWGDVLNGSIIYKATSCALAWAFVPSPTALATEVQTSMDSWNASQLGMFVNAAAAVPAGLGTMTDGASGCTGPTFTVPFPSGEVDVQPLNACDEPMSTVANWVKIVSTVILVVGGVVFVSYPILRAFGMPQLRKGSDDGV